MTGAKREGIFCLGRCCRGKNGRMLLKESCRARTEDKKKELCTTDIDFCMKKMENKKSGFAETERNGHETCGMEKS